MDAARTYITAVMARLDVIQASVTPFKIGDLTLAENDSPPIIKWVYGDIDHDAPVESGNIYTENQALIVHIWHAGADLDAAETNTRTLKNNLLIAARDVAQTSYAKQLAVGTFKWITPAHSHKGRSLVGELAIPLPVSARAQTFADIESVDLTGKATIDGVDETLRTQTLPIE